MQSQLQEVLIELRNQRREVQSLKEEVQGNTFSVSSEVKKLKSEREVTWKYQGNKIQYEFNSDIDEVVKQALWALQHNKVDYATELLNEVAEKVKKRNKLIRIADSSVGGWDTVKLYESNPIASDSEDESRINKAENRAIKRKRSIPKIKRISSAGGRSTDAPMHSMDRPIGAPPRSTFQAPYYRGRNFRGSYGSNSTTSVGYNGGISGTCYACGEFGHFRRDCHNVRTTAGNQPVTGK